MKFFDIHVSNDTQFWIPKGNEGVLMTERWNSALRDSRVSRPVLLFLLDEPILGALGKAVFTKPPSGDERV
jgi:hypothetical protein